MDCQVDFIQVLWFENYVRDIVRDPARNTMEHPGHHQDAHLYRIRTDQHEHQSHNRQNIYIHDQQGNLYEAQLHSQPNTNEAVMETSEVFGPGYGDAELNYRKLCENVITGQPVSTRTPTDHPTELFEPVRSVYHTARTKREDSRYMEEPSGDVEMRTKERKALFGTSDSEDDEASEASCCRTGKTRTDAKVSKTQHSSRRSGSPTTAKVRQETSDIEHPHGVADDRQGALQEAHLWTIEDATAGRVLQGE